jgi:hypothetical protein
VMTTTHARLLLANRLNPYLRQPGRPGVEETFCEILSTASVSWVRAENEFGAEAVKLVAGMTGIEENNL